MIRLREALLDERRAEADRLDDDVVRRVRQLLEELLARTIAQIALRPELAASDLGRLRTELEAALALFAQQATAELARALADAFDLGADVASLEVAAGGLRVALYGVSRQTLTVAQAFAADLVTGLTNDARTAITREIQLAALGGRSLTEVLRNVGTSLDDPGVFSTIATRAEAIVRTEVNRVYNTAWYQQTVEAGRSLPGLRKRWRHATGVVPTGTPRRGMYRPRPWHVALDGVSIPVEAEFDLGGEPARFPHDPRLSARNSVNCKCRLVLDASQLDNTALRTEPIRIRPEEVVPA